jgi:hypothetical protein
VLEHERLQALQFLAVAGEQVGLGRVVVLDLVELGGPVVRAEPGGLLAELR